MASNILFVQTQEIKNVIIETDAQGHNAITCKRDLKYNRLINNRNAACVLRKNIVIIRDREIKDTIIEADVHGNNTLKSFDEFVKEEIDGNSEDIFKGLLIKIRKKKDDQAEHLIDAYLTEKRESLQEKLKKATELHKSGRFSKAAELYESALDAIKYDSYPDEFMLDECDIFAIKFALVFSKIEMSDYLSFLSAEEVLLPLIEKYGAKFPSLYYYLAKVYYNLNNFTKAETTLQNGLKVLESLDYLTTLDWPGTKDKMIEKSTTNVLEYNMTQLLKQCKIFHMPDAKCYFTLCDKEERRIYFKSPIFKGYVSVKCTNKCNFTYHRPCWKNHLKFDNIKKAINLIGKTCQTSDCMGFVSQIIIFDESLQVINSLPGKSSKELNKGVKNGCKFTAPKIDQKPRNEEKESKLCPTKQKIKTEIKSEKDEDTPPPSVLDKQDLSSQVKVEPTQVETESQVSRMTEKKKFSFNTNAKEYVPSNQCPNFKLHNISISNNLIQFSEEDTHGNTIISSNLNSLAPEYVPPLRVIKMLEGNVIVKYCERATQCTEKYVEQAEYDSIKCDITILQEELFKSEESYNDLLSQYETLKVSTIKEKSDASTETDATTCDSCIDLYSNLKAKDELCTNIIKINEQLEVKIKELQQEVNELKNARILDKEVFLQSEQKYLNSNKVLMHKVQELLEEKDNIQKEFKKHRILLESNLNNNIPVLQKILLEQIGHCRNFYLSYITMFENKCKHMIWELEDLKTLTNAETLPSLSEVEENLNLWQQALNTIVKNHAMYLMFFENLFKKYSSDANQNLTATPLPALVPEPPSIVLRHFKSFFLLTKRLEQDLNRHMTNYYKMLSIPYPGVYPYGMTSSPVPLQSETEPEKLELPKRLSIELAESSKELVLDNKVAVLKPPPGFKCEPNGSNQEPTEIAMIDEHGHENEETLTINSSTLDMSYLSNPDNSQENLTDVESQIVEVEPTTSSQPVELFDEARALPIKQEKGKKPVVVGTDELLFKLQQKYPLIPPKILQEAVIIMREARGGLTGIDCKAMMLELKIIVNDLWKKERQKPGYKKMIRPEKSSPWTPINNNVLWKNHNPSGNCAICFEKMKESNSTQLRCQHVFHTECIKTWLKTNGICPICRSYNTLDDEFPPLK